MLAAADMNANPQAGALDDDAAPRMTGRRLWISAASLPSAPEPRGRHRRTVTWVMQHSTSTCMRSSWVTLADTVRAT